MKIKDFKQQLDDNYNKGSHLANVKLLNDISSIGLVNSKSIIDNTKIYTKQNKHGIKFSSAIMNTLMIYTDKNDNYIWDKVKSNIRKIK